MQDKGFSSDAIIIPFRSLSRGGTSRKLAFRVWGKERRECRRDHALSS